ncbi:DUF3240 family protein [Undibacterium rugosum]|uniref:DUF3240 family protein n=1 Tax=Undibacterium rugosum TaxID=2762291 RepID=A0A923I7W3_9BURK|nr:DUF3240 family protein [Undibacterium rugosum]MBC3934260.1 DUF3240 family protein [Undibacterium rugosum]MBR7779542.1 DUF3240 family protein [Undibacterium rugosum]
MIHNLEQNAVLQLAIPRTLDEDIADLLLAHPELASGFTLLPAQGMGQHTRLLSAMEQVQGRSQRQLFLVCGALAQLRALLQLLNQHFPGADIHYWITPVIESGSLQ